MKGFLFLVMALLVSHAAPAAAAGDVFEVSLFSMTLPVQFQTLDSHGKQVIATKTLKTADIVNLALGRPLSTKLDKATETLAFAADASTPGAGSTIVVFNPTTNTITATPFTTSNFILLSNQDFSKNVAYSNIDVQATTVGDFTHNALLATTFTVSGVGKSGSSFSSTSVAGPVSFTFTDASNVPTTITGVVSKGKGKAGKFLVVLGVF
jgi:hypothetical protein